MSGPVISADYSLGTDDVINYSCPVSNGTPPVPKLFFSTTYRVVGLLISVPVFLIGVIGNILVIYVVLSSTKMKTPINYYLVSLSLADLLVMLCATAPFFAELFLVVERWVLSRPMCPILVSLQYLSANASALSIMAFSVERYQAVCHPIKSKVSSKGQRAKRIILGVWSFCIVYNSMWLYLTSTSIHPLRTGECIVICHFSFKRSTYATIYMLDLICFYCIPLLITCVLYILIARAIFRSGHFRQSSTNKACTVKCVRRLTRDKVKVSNAGMLMIEK